MSTAASAVEVSVIIPCHNSTGTLGLQLEALAHQREAPPFEVIVSDNGSFDGLEDFLGPWRARLTLRYVDASRLPGAAFARNVGMSVASADKWLFCDSDDVVASDWVAQGNAALGEVDVFSGPGLKVADDEFDHDLESVWRRLDAGLPPGAPLQPGGVVPWPIILGGNSGLRRDVALAVGGYDASLTHGIEDNDLAVRLQQAGRFIAAASGVRILYREPAATRYAFSSSLEAGEWHMALCERYGLWDRSPHLRGGWWWLELPRCVLSGVRMALVPARRDGRGLVSRVGLAVGMWRGWLRFRVTHQLPSPELGVGLIGSSVVASEADPIHGRQEAVSSPEVSVIIPCHNSTQTLGLQLEALAHQVEAPPFEVIVADNRSSDRLGPLLDAWGNRLNLRHVEAGRLKGAAFARNVGMSVAKADKWLFCDSDDVVARDWVAQGSAALDEVDVFSGPGLKVTDAVLHEGLNSAWAHLDQELVPGAGIERGREVAWPIVFGANFGMRRAFALELGGFDAALSYGIEDNDLAVRVQRAGRTIALARGSRILYRIRATASAAFRQSHQAGEWHMALCERYGLWDRSPHLRGGWWWLELPRCVLSGVRMALVPARRDWRGLVSRVGLAVGMWRGWLRFRVTHQLPDQAIGEGLNHSSVLGNGRAVVFMPGILSGGGAERYAAETASALASLGYEAVLATTATADRERIGHHFGIDLSRVQVVDLSGPPSWARCMPRALFGLAEEAVWLKALRELRPDLFINCLYRSEIVGVGERNIYICHFPHRPHESYSGRLRRGYMATISQIRRAFLRGGKDFRDTYDVICANSRFTASHVLDRWQVEATVLHPPCPPMAANREKHRQIIVVGRVEEPVPGVPNKRLDVLVSAFVELTDLHEQGWVLHVVGACPDRSRPYLAELRAHAGDAPVFFHPNASYEELTELYSTSTLYWHAQGFGEDASDRPETQEHFGITTVEAMSAGAIPVVIDTAGPREVVDAVPGTGRWITIDELQAETRRLAALPDAELADLSLRCQERAREFDTAHFRGRLVEIVDGAAREDDPEWLTQHPVLVLSPHLDDALLSASEIIRRGKVEVWTVFAGEPDPPCTTAWDLTCGFADSRAQMVARWQEDRNAFAGTSAGIRHLPLLDGAYTTRERRAADLELLRQEVLRWVAEHADRGPVVVLPAGAGVPVPASPADHAVKLAPAPASLPNAADPVIEQLKILKHRAYLRRRRKAQRMGLAVNGDHLAVRDAMVTALAADDRVTLVLTEDLPYLWWHPADSQVDAVASRSNRTAVPGSFEVDRHWKHDRISRYASQLDVMDAEHRRLSSPATLPRRERYWELRSRSGGSPQGGF